MLIFLIHQHIEHTQQQLARMIHLRVATYLIFPVLFTSRRPIIQLRAGHLLFRRGRLEACIPDLLPLRQGVTQEERAF